MTQVLARFSDHDHCGIAYTYPIFLCRTTYCIDYYHTVFAVLKIVGGTIFSLHQQTILRLVGT
jgi:hypothetical protein